MNNLMGIITATALTIDSLGSKFKDDSIAKYQYALTCPRKKKKRLKKEALMDYSIALHYEENFKLI